jgi:predicted dehydrogenase
MTNTLKWGILSTARINRRFIPPAQESARSTVVAVASRQRESAQEFAQTWQIPQAFSSYEALLAAPEIDAVYIPLPNSMHHEWVIKAAEAGKHILCEKPLALTVVEVEAMMAAAEANGVVLLEAVVYQLHPQLAKLQTMLKEGLIGQVKLINGWFSFTLPPEAINFRLHKSLGGGSLWDVGGYPVSLANTIVGEAPQEVFGWQRVDANGIDTMFVGQLRYASGVMAQFNCGFRTAYRVGAEVVGDKGVIRIPEPYQPNVDRKTSGLIHIAPDDTQTHIETEVINPYLCQVLAMEKAVLDGEPLPFSPTQSRVNTATLTALRKSAASGQAVEVSSE